MKINILVFFLFGLCISINAQRSVSSNDSTNAKTKTGGHADTRHIEPPTAPPIMDLKNLAADTTISEDSIGVFDRAEIQPEFPGGMSELMKFLQTNIKYPDKAYEKKIQGKVIVKFYVDIDGKVKQPVILRDDLAGYGGAKEALRICNAMPKWKPGIQKGKPVKVYYTLPITFKLQ